MSKIALYSLLLVLGLTGSQFLNGWGEETIKILTMFCLSFIMINVGLEFDIEKDKPGKYAWDYLIAATAATFPWIFCAAYFTWVLDSPSWQEALLLSRFASPTSAGVLFTMLAAAGLASTWVFKKARILAIFDDLDTILLMIPLKILLVGMRWQLFAILAVIILLLYIAWRYLHRLRIPASWPWMFLYSGAITAICEMIYIFSKTIDEVSPVHLEVLLPAFVLGCVIAKQKHHDTDERVSTRVAALFMVLVGLSMPVIHAESNDWSTLAWHVFLVTLLSNLGKMFPFFCYRNEASHKERLALSISLFPRGEVGAGVLVISIGYGIGGLSLTVAILSLALNLLLTGVFIAFVKKLIVPRRA